MTLIQMKQNAQQENKGTSTSQEQKQVQTKNRNKNNTLIPIRHAVRPADWVVCIPLDPRKTHTNFHVLTP